MEREEGKYKDLNFVLSEYKSEVSPLCEPVRFTVMNLWVLK
jgi:hypothetical protein